MRAISEFFGNETESHQLTRGIAQVLRMGKLAALWYLRIRRVLNRQLSLGTLARILFAEKYYWRSLGIRFECSVLMQRADHARKGTSLVVGRVSGQEILACRVSGNPFVGRCRTTN